MPITRKQQILAKIESNEGTAETLGANDADQVYEPGFQDSVDFSDRVPAGPTISRDYTPPGRQTREFTFQTDLRGSGSTSTAPAFAKYLQAAAYKASTLRQLTLGAVTGTGFQPGEQVYQGASYAAATAIGVVVAVLSASNVPVKLGNASGQLLVVAVVSGAFLNTTATVGNSSASSSTITADAAYTGFCYQPTSDKIVRLQTNTWSGGVAAVGDSLELRHNTSNVLLGAVRVVRNNGGGTFDDLACTVLWLQNGGFDATAGNNKLVTLDGTKSATLSTAQVATLTPSLTMSSNLDGRLRQLLGGRGDFTLGGEVGQPLVFSWTFSGDIGTDSDAAQLATSGLGTVRPPRLLGSIASFGLGADLYQVPTKSAELAAGNTVSPNLDANRAGGATGSNVTDRDPTFTVTVDTLNGALDWESARNNGTPVRVALILGSTQGNICAVVAPNCQVTEVTPNDSDGVATFDVTLRALRINESGDDELYIAQI